MNNRYKPTKIISRMQSQEKTRQDNRRNVLRTYGKSPRQFRPTAGLSIHLADNANKYSKMFVQEA
jgi:hypothetical protein